MASSTSNRRARRILATARKHAARTSKARFHVSNIARETPCCCSCEMCGNPRKFETGKAALTRQELRAALTLREAIATV